MMNRYILFEDGLRHTKLKIIERYKSYSCMNDDSLI